jgi:protein tyrosine/serine phosphatase
MPNPIDGPSPKHIKRFAVVEPWLMRGDQPDRDGYEWLASHGVRSVVCLRKRNVDRKVRKAAPSLYSIHLPVKNDCPPTDQQALEWLQLCSRSKASGAVFVHCRGGKGRTSVFCALVRAAQGWTYEDAIAEQRKFGFKPEGEHKRQAIFLADFFRRYGDSIAGAPKL